MKYVLINPVVDQMYDRAGLDAVLCRNGYERVECKVSWGPIVKDKYAMQLNQNEDTIIDVRCPVAADKIKEEFEEAGMQIPAIDPILLHCGREISEQEELAGVEKVITTPCKALADAGNRLGLKETTFIAWNEFEATLEGELVPDKLDASPIPPGFFHDMEYKIDSISGCKEIQTYFKEGRHKNTRLVELLYCQEGCHNGDGVNYYE